MPGLRWRVLALVKPLEQAQFVSVWSAGYSMSVPLSDASHGLVCEHRPPVTTTRSLKWVERLEVTAQRAPKTGELIARQRFLVST